MEADVAPTELGIFGGRVFYKDVAPLALGNAGNSGGEHIADAPRGLLTIGKLEASGVRVALAPLADGARVSTPLVSPKSNEGEKRRENGNALRVAVPPVRMGAGREWLERLPSPRPSPRGEGGSFAGWVEGCELELGEALLRNQSTGGGELPLRGERVGVREGVKD